ncbi:hypothetical protein SAMN05444392_12028 [Seinonella peptonophila]|uniref:WD40-like Beta Propeller Repeat n=1 Tax=Seinonella peptonophila TaxID=112248 RepID=A0A1M5BB64_9BACL|nr:hypothetical protein [Seinonella peptonophila]SHF39557.1 hypothetical protein SAMN05444392_12028 [Seinonella peptonophila]
MKKGMLTVATSIFALSAFLIGAPHLPVSADGGKEKILYTQYKPSQYDVKTELYHVDPNGKNKTLLTKNGEGEEGDISPDGKQIVFHGEYGDGGLFTIPSSGGKVTKVNKEEYEPPTHRIPAWTPDKKKIVYFSPNNRAEKSPIQVINSNGTSDQTITTIDAIKTQIKPTPDGKGIAYSYDSSSNKKDGGGDIYTINLNGSKKKNITHTSNIAETLLGWTIDHKKILFTDGKDLYTIRPDGTQKAKIVDLPSSIKNVTAAAFSPNGKEIAIANQASEGKTTIYKLPVKSKGAQLKEIVKGNVALNDWAAIK